MNYFLNNCYIMKGDVSLSGENSPLKNRPQKGKKYGKNYKQT